MSGVVAKELGQGHIGIRLIGFEIHLQGVAQGEDDFISGVGPVQVLCVEALDLQGFLGIQLKDFGVSRWIEASAQLQAATHGAGGDA